jgi:hypothetical protein
MSNEPILIAYDYWINSQLSIAKYYDGIRINKQEYRIIGNKHDLVRKDWCDIYMKLGRDKTIELIKSHTTLKEAKALLNKKKKVNEMELGL